MSTCFGGSNAYFGPLIGASAVRERIRGFALTCLAGIDFTKEREADDTNVAPLADPLGIRVVGSLETECRDTIVARAKAIDADGGLGLHQIASILE